MPTVELEADIVDHRIDIRSELLPAKAKRAKVILVFEEAVVETGAADRDGLNAVAKLREARQGVNLNGLSSGELRREGRR